MVGYFSASNHFSLFACVFFIPFPVLIVETSMVASNFDVARLLGSKLIVAFNPPKVPDGSPPENFMEYASVIFHSCETRMVNEEAIMSNAVSAGKKAFFMSSIFNDG